MAEPSNDKLSSLFAKKKKNRKSTTVNANVIAKGIANSSAPAPKPSASAATSASSVSAPAPASKAASPPVSAATATKKLSELTLGDKDESEDRAAFQWAKQPKKYKNMNEPKEGVARTWEEQEQRNRTARRIKLDSERAFPTLGADSAKAQLTGMKAPEAKAVATKNVWASLDHDEDSD